MPSIYTPGPGLKERSPTAGPWGLPIVGPSALKWQPPHPALFSRVSLLSKLLAGETATMDVKSSG